MGAKPAKQTYERNLPHIQGVDRPIFVTFCTYERWILPEEVRDHVLRHCLHDHGTKLWMHAAIVMPDHSHLLFTRMNDTTGATFGLAEIMNGVKGASAHTVNRLLKRKGHVWQDESFDHVLRCDENLRLKAEYICENPVRQNLVKSVDEYRWIWREWTEGAVP